MNNFIHLHILIRNFFFYKYRTICQCAELAKLHGYRAFGIVYYGECWGYGEDGEEESTDCINGTYNECTDTDEVCVGKENSGFVFMIE